MKKALRHRYVQSKETRPAILKLTVIEATLHRDTELIGKMDPYVVISDGHGKQAKTHVKQDAGKHAVFNE